MKTRLGCVAVPDNVTNHAAATTLSARRLPGSVDYCDGVSTPVLETQRAVWQRLGEPLRFCVVGGSGVVVNLIAFILLSKAVPVDPHDAAFPLYPTPYNVRWLHILSFGAFIVANLWNFELNRIWTFRTHARVQRTRFAHFFTVGLAAQSVGFLILTLLTHPHSPLQLPTSVFDGSSGFRTRAYWAQLIMIITTTPLSFLLNKFWTFAHKPPADREEQAPASV